MPFKTNILSLLPPAAAAAAAAEGAAAAAAAASCCSTRPFIHRVAVHRSQDTLYIVIIIIIINYNLL